MKMVYRRLPIRHVLCALTLLTLTALSSPSNAQESTNIIRRLIHEFVGVGGYWFTDSSAENALGSPKFAGSTKFFSKPAHRSNLQISGGIELFGMSDHWLFGGGNSFDLYGGSFQINPERGHLYRFTPFVNPGLFLGHIHSDRLDFRDTGFVPSMAVGAEMKVHRYITVTGRYRISGTLHGVNTDGYMFSLKFF